MNLSKPVNPRIGDAFLDRSCDKVYIYTGHSNVWLESVNLYLLPRSAVVSKSIFCKLKDIPGIVTLFNPTMKPGKGISNRVLIDGVEIVFDQHTLEVRSVQYTDTDAIHVTGINFDPNIVWHKDIILDNLILEL